MTIDALLNKLNNAPDTVAFSEVMETIELNFNFTETAFTNGKQHNRAGENSGSCKVFSFAQLYQLSKNQTLALFGEYYRNDVLKNPNLNDHQNIRQFMQHGFQGITFEKEALTAKQ